VQLRICRSTRRCGSGCAGTLLGLEVDVGGAALHRVVRSASTSRTTGAVLVEFRGEALVVDLAVSISFRMPSIETRTVVVLDAM